MAISNNGSFWEMCRELPVKTAVASVVPVVVGLAQLLNGLVNGVALTYTGGFAVVMVVTAVLITRYNLVEFERIKLQRELFDDG